MSARMHHVIPIGEDAKQLRFAHAFQVHLTLEAVAQRFHHHQKRDEPDQPQQQHGEQHHLLDGVESEQQTDDNRHAHAQHDGSADEDGVAARETGVPRFQFLAIAVFLGEGTKHMSYSVRPLWRQRFFAVVQVALVNLPGGHAHDIRHERSQEQTKPQAHKEEHAQGNQVLGEIVPVEAAYRLAHGVDAVRERQERVNRLEEAGRHFHGIQTRCAGYLREHQHDAKRLAHMPERGGKRIDNTQEGKRRQRRRREKGGNVCRLHTERERAGAADERLHNRKDAEHEEAPQITLPRLGILDTLGVHLEQEDYHEHESAYPERQVHEQRRHCGAVGVGVIELLGLELRGRTHELRDVLRVQRAVIQKVGDDVGLRQHARVGHHRIEVGLHAAYEGAGL